MGKPVYEVHKEEDGTYVIVNRRIGYVVRECENKREADMMAQAFNHRAEQPDEDDDTDPPADPPADPPKPGDKVPPPAKPKPPAPKPTDPADPPSDSPKNKHRSRWWGELDEQEATT